MLECASRYLGDQGPQVGVGFVHEIFHVLAVQVAVRVQVVGEITVVVVDIVDQVARLGRTDPAAAGAHAKIEKATV